MREEEQRKEIQKILELQNVGFMYYSFNFSMGQKHFKVGGKLLENLKKRGLDTVKR